MPYNDSAKRASLKFQQDKLKQVRFWVKREEAEALKQEAEQRGQSVRRFIVESINTSAGREIVAYGSDDAEDGG